MARLGLDTFGFKFLPGLNQHIVARGQVREVVSLCLRDGFRWTLRTSMSMSWIFTTGPNNLMNSNNAANSHMFLILCSISFSWGGAGGSEATISSCVRFRGMMARVVARWLEVGVDWTVDDTRKQGSKSLWSCAGYYWYRYRED